MENIFCFDDVTVNTFTVSKPAWVRLSLSTPWEFFKLTELVPRFRLSVQLGSLKFNQQYCSNSLLTKSTYCINLCKVITRYASNLNLVNTKSHNRVEKNVNHTNCVRKNLRLQTGGKNPLIAPCKMFHTYEVEWLYPLLLTIVLLNK